ncbi:MAG: FxsA family protein [Gemmatimonadota bacterium]|nr:MAG: FxsA family protein [Gemmatimonadota bacterium]
MGKLLFLFIVVPIVELILLIQLGGLIGLWPTIGLIVVTGAAGASLARWQGLSVLRQIQLDMTSGRLPGGALVDGVIILMAAALLVTPGLLTDVFGFLCLVPGFRGLVKRALRHRFERAIADGRGSFFISIGGGGRGPIG